MSSNAERQRAYRERQRNATGTVEAPLRNAQDAEIVTESVTRNAPPANVTRNVTVQGLPQDAEAHRIALAWQHVAAQHGVEVSEDALLAAVARGRAAVTRDDVQSAKRLLGKSTSTCLENQST